MSILVGVAVAVLRTPSGCLDVLVSLTQGGGGWLSPGRRLCESAKQRAVHLEPVANKKSVVLNCRSVGTSEDMKRSEKSGRCLDVPDVVSI